VGARLAVPLREENRMMWMTAVRALGRLVRRDEGQDLMEYGLLMFLIAVVAMAGVTAVGSTINAVFWEYIAGSF